MLYLDKIRDDVTQRSLIAKRQMELKDMIIEDEVPDIGYVFFPWLEKVKYRGVKQHLKEGNQTNS